MEIISLKDYARQKNISYEAVRQQIVRYASDLDGHIIKDGRQQFLDAEAVAFLDAKRKKNPVAIYQIEKDEEIERLENQNKELLLKLSATQEQLIKAQDEYRQLSDKANKIALLEADNEKARAAKKEAEERADVADQERREAEKLAEQIRKEAKMRLDEAEIAEEARQEAERRAQIAEDIAQANEQEAARAKKEAENLRAELEALKCRNFWQRLFNK